MKKDLFRIPLYLRSEEFTKTRSFSDAVYAEAVNICRCFAWRILTVSGILLLCWGIFMSPSLQAEEPEAEPPRIVPRGDLLPDVTARSAIVMEAKTGHVLYERNADQRMFPASTTKMMTLITALEDGNLDDIVTVSRNAAETDGSTLWLEAGERIRLENLLYGMMMVSGNDATVAVAEHMDGSVSAFARRMTKRAHELGAKSTNFMNSSGLPDENHYTTARDLAWIAIHGFTVPGFEEIVSTKEGIFPWVHDPSHFMRNENQMLWLYEGANGIKTGYTDAAGRCLVSSAKRDGIQLVAVVLDALYMWNDSIAMLDEGFRQVTTRKVVTGGRVEKTLPVSSGRKKTVDVKTTEDIQLPEFSNGIVHYELQYELPKEVHAPVAEGDRIGTLHILLEGREVAATPLVTTESIEQKSFFRKVWRMLREFLGISSGKERSMA